MERRLGVRKGRGRVVGRNERVRAHVAESGVCVCRGGAGRVGNAARAKARAAPPGSRHAARLGREPRARGPRGRLALPSARAARRELRELAACGWGEGTENGPELRPRAKEAAPRGDAHRGGDPRRPRRPPIRRASAGSRARARAASLPCTAGGARRRPSRHTCARARQDDEGIGRIGDASSQLPSPRATPRRRARGTHACAWPAAELDA